MKTSMIITATIMELMAAWQERILTFSHLEGIMASKAIKIHMAVNKIKAFILRIFQVCLVAIQIWVEVLCNLQAHKM